ncbi:MAG: ThiF family adenylyltransferase [Bacteroidota bacterium]
MMDRNAVLRQVPGWDLDRIRAARILVVGAGALGNEVLKNLALLNVGEIAILDFDRVEASNLSRSVLFREVDARNREPKAEVAARRLHEINPEVSALAMKGDVMTDLGLGFLRTVDVAIGCVDNRLARLYLNRWCFRVGLPWVDGGILNLSGQVSAYRSGEACYECGLGEQAWRDIRQRMGCADMAMRYAVAGQMPTTPLSASLIAAVQVQEALRLLHGDGQSGLVGKLFSYEGQTLHAEVYDLLPPRAECDSHYYYGEGEELPGGSAEMRLGDLWAGLRMDFGLVEPVLELDHPLARELATLKTGRRIARVLPALKLSAAVGEALAGEPVGVPRGKLVSRVRPGMGLDDLRLIDLGIPHWHILTIRDKKRRLHLELAGDRGRFFGASGVQIAPHPWFEYRP